MRRIIHLDMDAFYAAIEQRDRPELKGTPVIVGGSRERGVVSACSYEARRFGVRSAMPITRAVALCPAATVLPVRMSRYREVSRQVFAIFQKFTDLIEPLSIDEAFLDVTGSERLLGPAEVIAGRIREMVRQETQLAVSAGVAPNKILAKLASEAAKPDGLKEIRPEDVDGFLLPLPVSRLWGVGAVAASRLEAKGVRTVSDLRRMEKDHLLRLFGRWGEQLHALARGVDERPVESEASVKSIGREETFEQDIRKGEELRRELLSLAEEVARRLRRKEVSGRTLTLKVRFADFSAVTRSRTFVGGLDHGPDIFREAEALLARTQAGALPVRLLGISMSQLEERGSGQIELFGEETRRGVQALDQAMDRLRERYGAKGICRGTLLEPRGSEGKKGTDGIE